MAKERLQKLLAQANIASRRASEDLISHGRVTVNGEVAKLGDKADPQTDEILVDGARLKFDAQKPIYIAAQQAQAGAFDRQAASHRPARRRSWT